MLFGREYPRVASFPCLKMGLGEDFGNTIVSGPLILFFLLLFGGSVAPMGILPAEVKNPGKELCIFPCQSTSLPPLSAGKWIRLPCLPAL